jgi:hypothetical protein
LAAGRVTLRTVPDPETTLPFATRFWFAWSCFIRILFDGAFARGVWQTHSPEALLEASAPAPALPPPAKAEPTKAPKEAAPPSMDPALSLLSLLQREGRLVDFLEQDITSFGDAEVGAAARVVHEGCRRALRSHVKIAPVRAEEEGAAVALPSGYSPTEVKLSGNVQGSPPYKGVLRHRGWRATDLVLPTPVKGHDPSVIAPAEVEL